PHGRSTTRRYGLYKKTPTKKRNRHRLRSVFPAARQSRHRRAAWSQGTDRKQSWRHAQHERRSASSQRKQKKDRAGAFGRGRARQALQELQSRPSPTGVVDKQTTAASGLPYDRVRAYTFPDAASAPMRYRQALVTTSRPRVLPQ